jgi:hypothetical protein
MYPQLTTGALSQFPIRKGRRQRTIINAAADGSAIKLADPAGAIVEWQLTYTGLSDTELAALQQFFVAAEGSLNGFTFVDPSGNLLAWSEDLSNAVWDPGPFLSATGGIADPLGGTGGWHLSNSGAGSQSMAQTLNTPAGYIYSFSIYARAAQVTTVNLVLGSHSAVGTLGSDWSLLTYTGSGDPTAASITFGIELPPGGAIDVFGPQVEPQPEPSAYKISTAGGVYENARFRGDSFSFTSTDVNRNSTTVNIFYANHI